MIVENLVSVIIPVFNRPKELVEAVGSVVAQTWPYWEILICDDGSSSETREMSSQLVSRYDGKIFYLRQDNQGPGLAREMGRKRARGEFIQYLDSDDLLWPKKFETQIKMLRADPGSGAAYGWIRLCPVDSAPIDKPHKWSGSGFDRLFPSLLVDRWWNTNAPLWRRAVADQIGPWSDLRYSQDWEYDARAGALGVRLAYCPEFQSDQRQHRGTGQTGHGRWLSAKDRVRFFGALWSCAQKAGVNPNHAEARHFSRWVFRHARECAAAGEEASARALLALAMEVAVGRSKDECAIYRKASDWLGWQRVSVWSEAARRWRGGAKGSESLLQSWMS